VNITSVNVNKLSSHHQMKDLYKKCEGKTPPPPRFPS
jgi:hypothetical protein